MMLRRSLFAGVMLAACSVALSQESVPGQLIVRYTTTNYAAINAKIGATVINHNAALNIATIKLPSGLSIQAADTWFTNQAGVKYAEPNYIYRATFVPNDPAFQGQQYAPQRINAIAGWDRSQGSPNVTIAILDSGVDLDHPDLQAKIVPGFDFVNNDSDADDDNGHGTHCAGIAAAVTNNGVGIAGIAPNCKIMPVKVLNAGGAGATDWIVNGITWAADNGAKVISLSLGGYGASQATKDAGAYALSKGAFPLAAAGNDNTSQQFYPAAWDEYLAVGATDQNDQKAGFSNFDASWVDVAAPGVNIYSTLPGGTYGNSSGTSMACPVVAGLAGVVRSVNLSMTPAQARTLIQNGCNAVGPWVRFGRVNMLNSIPQTLLTTPINFSPILTTTFEGNYAAGNNASTVNSDNLYYKVNAVNVLRTGRVASAVVTINSGNRNPVGFQGLSVTVEAGAASGVTLSTYIWDRTLSGGQGGWTYLGSSPMTTADKTVKFTVGYNAGKHFDNARNAKFLVRGIYPNKPNIPAQSFQLRVDRVVATALVPTN